MFYICQKKIVMKAFFIIVYFIFSVNSVFSQIDKEKIPENIKIPAGVDLKNINPADVTPENLRKLGATEEQINETMQRKKAMLEGSQPLKEEQSIVKEETSNQTEETKEPEEPKDEPDKGDVIQKYSVSGVYGHDFFRNNTLKFYEKATEVKAQDNYTLGIGDEINVSIWGYSDFNGSFTIDKYGSIHPKLVGKIYLKEMKFEDAKSLLTNRFAAVYDLINSQIEITLTYSRIISVNIVGEVLKPGSYTIPAINTAFNALVGVGGITNIGSVRKIFIKRDGKTRRTLDVYEFLMNPNADQDFFLENNDYIFVPIRGKTVKISGEINRPFSYELLENENLFTLIKYSGELTSAAFKENIQVKRYYNNSEEILIDLDLDSLQKNKIDFKLLDGDEITIKRLPEGIKNFVEVRGAVKLPGIYEFKPSSRISDLLLKAEGVLFDTYLDEAYLIRTKDDLSSEYFKINLYNVLYDSLSEENIHLQGYDILQVFSKSYFVDIRSVSIEGAVRNPGKFAFGEGLTLKHLLNLAGCTRLDAYLDRAFILRLKEDLTREYIPFSIDTSNNYQILEKINLLRQDIVRIYSQKYFKDEHYVTVNGMVRNPDKYTFNPGMTLADALLLSGGLKSEAAKNRIEVSRIINLDESINSNMPTKTEILSIEVSYDITKDKNAQSFKLQPYDIVFVRKIPEFELQKNVSVNGEVKFPGLYTLTSKDEKLASVIERAGGLTEWAFAKGAALTRTENEAGLLILNLKRALRRKNAKTNYVLKEGDIIYIPAIVDLINIRGAIDYPVVKSVNAPFHRFRRAGFYIRKYAGGFDKNARKRKTYVMYPNALKKNTCGLGLFNIYPRVKKGSMIAVLYKPEKKDGKEKQKRPKEPFDMNKTLESFMIKITALATIFILVDRAFE